MNKLIKQNKQVLFILFLVLVLRLVVINQSLWLDEAIGAEAVRDFSYREIITEFMRFDNHPPFYYLTLKFWVNLFGYSEASLRFPSIIFGVLTVFLSFHIAKRINKDKVDFFPALTGLLLATSQFHIYYSQEARMYSMAAFFATLAIYSFINILDENSNIWWLIFSISVAFLMFTDYAPVFLLPTFWLYGLVKKQKLSWWLKFVISHIILLAFGFLWLPTFLYQAGRGKWLLETLPGWRKVAGGATIKQALLVWMKFVFGRLTFPGKLYYYILVGLSSLPFILSFIKLAFAKKAKYIDLVILWLITPLLLGFVSSFWFPAFTYFRFLYVLPAFYILVAWSISTFKIKAVRYLLTGLLIGINVFGWLIYVSDERQQREKWREATRFVEVNSKETEIFLFDYPQAITPFRWYAKELSRAYGATDSISLNSSETERKVRNIIKDKTGLYYFEYLRDLSDPKRIVEKTIKEEGFEMKEVYNFQGVGQIFYYVRP